MNMMLFVAASIDVVIIKVLCICTPCFVAAAAATQRLRFHFFFHRELAYRGTAGWCCLFLLLEFFRVCCLHFFLANHLASDLFSITILTSTHKKVSIFFVALFSVHSTFRVLYISSIPALHLIRTVPWCASFIYIYVALFRLLFHFYFVPIPKNLSLFFVYA